MDIFSFTFRQHDALKAEFYNHCMFPGVIGAIDCTHVAKIAPPDNANLFINRKHFYSMNVQIVSI
jgi:hypothetical protein